ncbi:hypothetical protein Ddc_15661 [Ditylenchus destructor]|nr:hypothetical protein Ddc_15661 [Ditylenchus destructor]
MARKFCGFAFLFLCVIIQFMQAMSQSDDCPADAPCGTDKSHYTGSNRSGYCTFLLEFNFWIRKDSESIKYQDSDLVNQMVNLTNSNQEQPDSDSKKISIAMIRHNGMVCVCHPRRLPQEKESSEAMFVVNEPTEQKHSSSVKRSLADSALSYESDCPADAPCGTQESDYTYSKRYGYLIEHNGMVCVCHPRRLPQNCPSEAPCGIDFGDQKSGGFYLAYKGSYCFCSPRLHGPRYQPKRDVFVLNGPDSSDFPKPQPLHIQYKLKKGREYELGSRGKCPSEAPCYVDRQPDGFC